MSEEKRQISQESPPSEGEQLSLESMNEQQPLLEKEVFVAEPKKITLRSILKNNLVPISLICIAIILVIVGLLLFYLVENISLQIGFWLAVAGVILFMFTMIFGFEKINLSD